MFLSSIIMIYSINKVTSIISKAGPTKAINTKLFVLSQQLKTNKTIIKQTLTKTLFYINRLNRVHFSYKFFENEQGVIGGRLYVRVNTSNNTNSRQIKLYLSYFCLFTLV